MKIMNNEPKKAMKTGIEGRGRPSSRWDEPVLGRVFQGLRPWLISVVALRPWPPETERWEKVGWNGGFFPQSLDFYRLFPSFPGFSRLFPLKFFIGQAEKIHRRGAEAQSPDTGRRGARGRAGESLGRTPGRRPALPPKCQGRCGKHSCPINESSKCVK